MVGDCILKVVTSVKVDISKYGNNQRANAAYHVFNLVDRIDDASKVQPIAGS